MKNDDDDYWRYSLMILVFAGINFHGNFFFEKKLRFAGINFRVWLVWEFFGGINFHVWLVWEFFGGINFRESSKIEYLFNLQKSKN